MILAAGPRRVFVATRPVDFRPRQPVGCRCCADGSAALRLMGMDGLAALAQEQLRLDPLSGVAVVFRAKRADRVKILLWDGSGMVLVAKRLEEGRFAWPLVKDGVMTLSAAQLAALFDIAERCPCC